MEKQGQLFQIGDILRVSNETSGFATVVEPDVDFNRAHSIDEKFICIQYFNSEIIYDKDFPYNWRLKGRCRKATKLEKALL